MHPDDLANPEYRKGRSRPFLQERREPVRRPPPTEDARRAQFAVQTARAEFGRFYWNGELAKRMERELKQARRHRRDAEHARARKRDGGSR